MGPAVFTASLVRLAGLAALSSVSVAALACEQLQMEQAGTVAAVPDGDSIILADGTSVRLIGMQAPKLALGRTDFPDWPLAGAARDALSELVKGRAVQLGYGGEKRDRYERALAHVFVQTEAGPVWAQQALIARGLARVYSFPDNRACLELLFAAEGRARLGGLGIWADPYYSVRAADRPAELIERAGHYELVEGRVHQAARTGGRVYLNFGRVWKDDFTAVIEGPALRLFAKAGLNPLVLDGALVRVRGWVDERDGPRIEVTHPEQIEVLATR